jgi:hypothetical protein
MRVARQSRPAGVGPGRSTGRRSFRTHSARSPPQAGRARHRSRVVDQRHTCLVVRSYARSRWQAAGSLCLRAAKRGEKIGSRQWAVGNRVEDQRVAGEAAGRGGEFIHGEDGLHRSDRTDAKTDPRERSGDGCRSSCRVSAGREGRIRSHPTAARRRSRSRLQTSRGRSPRACPLARTDAALPDPATLAGRTDGCPPAPRLRRLR